MDGCRQWVYKLTYKKYGSPVVDRLVVVGGVVGGVVGVAAANIKKKIKFNTG